MITLKKKISKGNNDPYFRLQKLGMTYCHDPKLLFTYDKKNVLFDDSTDDIACNVCFEGFGNYSECNICLECGLKNHFTTCIQRDDDIFAKTFFSEPDIPRIYECNICKARTNGFTPSVTENNGVKQYWFLLNSLGKDAIKKIVSNRKNKGKEIIKERIAILDEMRAIRNEGNISESFEKNLNGYIEFINELISLHNELVDNYRTMKKREKRLLRQEAEKQLRDLEMEYIKQESKTKKSNPKRKEFFSLFSRTNRTNRTNRRVHGIGGKHKKRGRNKTKKIYKKR